LKTILVLDDEELIRKFVKNVMGADGTRVVEAGNGRVALDVLQELDGGLIWFYWI
jgi:CheY-like chemotaxis protein